MASYNLSVYLNPSDPIQVLFYGSDAYGLVEAATSIYVYAGDEVYLLPMVDDDKQALRIGVSDPSPIYYDKQFKTLPIPDNDFEYQSNLQYTKYTIASSKNIYRGSNALSGSAINVLNTAGTTTSTTTTTARPTTTTPTLSPLFTECEQIPQCVPPSCPDRFVPDITGYIKVGNLMCP